MCNDANCRHDDPLDDDLGDIFGGDLSPEDISAGVHLAKTQPVRGLVEETCQACRGTGKFRSYSGRVVGDCFKCKGAGKRYFKSTLEQREKAKTQRDTKKAHTAQELREQFSAWLLANPDEDAWLRSASARGFEFAQSMLDAGHKYGHLTERQEAAVRKATAKSLERQAQWTAEREAREANRATVDIARIAEAFAAARAARLKWPKLRLDTFEFSLASETSRNAGAIYVKDDAAGTYLGKIVEGKFTRSRDCDDAAEARIVAACADPHAAAQAYGHRTGVCSCCGRELTNALSVSLGIGPICREKWGWA